MKKSILLLGGVGIGVGLAFALRSHHDDRSNTSDVEGNGDKTDGRAAQNTIGAEIQVSGPENISIEKKIGENAVCLRARYPRGLISPRAIPRTQSSPLLR